MSDTTGMERWRTVSSKHVFGVTVTLVLVCVLLILVVRSQDISAVRLQMLLKGKFWKQLMTRSYVQLLVSTVCVEAKNK